MPRGSSGSENIIPELTETSSFLSGYNDKVLKDEVPAGSAVRGSFNFILDIDGKWTTRGGTEYLGTLDTLTGGTTSSGKIVRRDAVEIPIVFFGTRSKVFHNGSSDWQILETGLTTDLIWGKAMGEKTTDNMNQLIMGNGTDAFRTWNGATALVSSVTATTIVATGTATLANRGFTATGNLSVRASGVAFAYTGLSGSTFTGVTPDPTTNGVVANDPITQVPVSSGSLPVGSVMASLNGRIVLFVRPSGALEIGGSIQGSQLNLYDNFTFSSPRVAAEGFQLMMQEGGGNGMAMVQFEGGLACFKQNAVSKLQVTLDQNDFPSMQPLLPYDDSASGHVGCVGQKAAFALRNQVFFISPRGIINTLQRVSRIDYPQALPFSDRIQKTCNDMTWDTESCAFGFDYMALFVGKDKSTDGSPNKTLVYDQRYDAWWTPITGIEIQSFFVRGGNLYATLGSAPDVVRLFTGTRDYVRTTSTGVPIDAKLVLERQNYGKKSTRKKSRRLYIEGWMSKSGVATIKLTFDENRSPVEGTIRGTDEGYFFDPAVGGLFGEEGFGVTTFGGKWDASSDTPEGVGHFRILFNYLPTSWWNEQFSVETSSYFKLITKALDPVSTNVGFPPTLKATLG